MYLPCIPRNTQREGLLYAAITNTILTWPTDLRLPLPQPRGQKDRVLHDLKNFVENSMRSTQIQALSVIGKATQTSLLHSIQRAMAMRLL